MKSLDLSGRVAIITGGAGGIGSATARLMAERGASVVVADIAADRARDLAAELVANGGQALGLVLDLAEESSIKALVESTIEHFGRLDILHNNAAALKPELGAVDLDISRLPTWAWDETFAINCRGAMIATREALPHLLVTRGCIVNMVSNLALRGHFMQTAYAASKAALIQLTRSVAASHSSQGVRCNAVAPGMTLTPALKAAFPEALLKLVGDETLRNTLGAPEDIAEVVAFVASDAARNITGEIIVADGGYVSHIPGFNGLKSLLVDA